MDARLAYPGEEPVGLAKEKAMDQIQAAQEGIPLDLHADHDKHVVAVLVDSVRKMVRRGKYVVSEFKKEVAVLADYELDEVVAGEFYALADDATIHIKGDEVFVSHVRRGGSS